MENFGERIRKRQAEQGVSDSHLAELVGVSRQAVLKWKSGETQNMKFDNILKVARILDMSLDELVSGTKVNITTGQKKDISAQELMLLNLYRDMSENQQREWIVQGIAIKRRD